MDQTLNPLSAPLFRPGRQIDPYPIYAQLREQEPAHWVELPGGECFWLITRYDDVALVLSDARFVSDPTNAGHLSQYGTSPFVRLVATSDPPEHTCLRALVRPPFASRMIERLRPRIQQIVDDLIDAVASTGVMDVVDAYASPLPMTVITELLGVPAQDTDRFRPWSNTMVDTDFTIPRQATEHRRQLVRDRVINYFGSLLDDKRVRPGDDVMSELIQAEQAGLIAADEALAMIWLLLIDGYEPMVSLIGNATLALLSHPDQLAKLRDDQSLIGSAVEEFLRYDGPAAISGPRYASEDLMLAGQHIARGDPVHVGLGSANRDERFFPAPDQLDITRSPNRHLAFGRDLHFCLGAPLARLEAQIAIGALVRRLPRLRLAIRPEELTWRPGLVFRTLRSLPVEF